MGSGKSTLGKALAKQKNIAFIDLDSYVEAKENSSVCDLFKTKGEIYFRKKESLYLKELMQLDTDFVLALGGGTPCFGTNMDIILEATKNVIYLKYSYQSLVKRLACEKENRPLLSHLADDDLEDFIRKHLFERNPYYTRATYVLAMDNLSVDESLQEIDKVLYFK